MSLFPFQVLRIRISEGQAVGITEVYSNDGTELSGSTVGVAYKDGLLVGSILTHCLYCRLEKDRH